MDKKTIFINCAPDDHAIGEKIQEELQANGFSCYYPNDDDTVAQTFSLVEKLDEISHSGGIMVAILSESALENARFISNVQYFCELSGKKRVIVFYQTDSISRENPVALYYPQSVLVKGKNKIHASLNNVVINVKRLLGIKTPPTIPKRIPAKVIWRWALSVVILSLMAGVISFFRQEMNTPPEPIIMPATPTPIVMNIPFSQDSIDQGLIIEQSSMPLYQPKGNPKEEAPFYHQPETLTKILTFTDPAFNNVFKADEIIHHGSNIGNTDLFVVKQINEVLQISVQGQRPTYQDFAFRYYFPLSEIQYIGIRFKLGDFSGWITPEEETNVDFNLSGTECIFLGQIDMQRQLYKTDPDYFLGTTWHTLEMIFDHDQQEVITFLDGNEVDRSSQNLELNQLSQLSSSLSVFSSTEWLSLYIDEINYSVVPNQPPAENPEDAPFSLIPDELHFQSQFNDAFLEYNVSGYTDNLSMKDEQMAFHIPESVSGNEYWISLTPEPLSAVNYYAIRYRFDPMPIDPWLLGRNLSMKLVPNTKQDRVDEDSIIFSISNNSLLYPEFLMTLRPSVYSSEDESIGQFSGLYGGPDNLEAGYWHTLEYLIYPTTDSTGYHAQSRIDGFIISDGPIYLPQLEDNPETARLRLVIDVFSGAYGTQPFSGKIDEIITGYVNYDETTR
jgi:hypothetical protein